MRVLITGGNGFIGSRVAAEALRKDHEVCVFDLANISPDSALSGHPRLELAQGLDICSEQDVESIFDSFMPEAVIHLAAKTSVADGVDSLVDTNIKGTNIIAGECLVRDVKIVFASTAAVYGNHKEPCCADYSRPVPCNVYGLTKLAGERLLDDCDCTALRLFNVFGSGQRNMFSIWIEAAKAGKPLKVFTGPNGEKMYRNFVDVDYVARAFVAALESDFNLDQGNIRDICSADCIAIEELATMVAKSFGVEVISEPSPPTRVGEIIYSNGVFAKIHDIGVPADVREWLLEVLHKEAV
jgi:UDP-glucose 4-epimerase